MSTTNPLDAALLQTLRSRLRGPVLEPGEAGYEESREIWNSRYDRRPAAIARCMSAADVMAAVDLARECRLLLAVKSGGHDYAGNSCCDGGLLIDLSGMNEIRVDPKVRRAWVEPGARWGEVTQRTQEVSLAPACGTVSTVGVAGFTLGGGTGYLTRKHGLGVDNLLSAEVVTANGELLRVSEDQNSDLFWAMRGGSGNFGIATSFELALHEVGPVVVSGQIIYPLAEARAILRSFREFMAEAPEELQCLPFFFRIPPLAEFPQESHGHVAMSLVVVHIGSVEAAKAAIAPLRELGTRILEDVGPRPFLEALQMFDAGVPKGQRWYTRGHYLGGLPDGAIDALLDRLEALPGIFSMAYFEPLEGAVARVDHSATAFPHRSATYGFHVLTGWNDPLQDDAVMLWTRALHEAMAPYSTGGVYVNLLGSDEKERVPAAYGANYDRLTRVKKKYDPENLFRSNHNIEPVHI